jgi:hypothetical protein
LTKINKGHKIDIMNVDQIGNFLFSALVIRCMVLSIGYVILIFVIIRIQKLADNKLNEYIDNEFERQYVNRTNAFIRFFIDIFDKKSEIEYAETKCYRERYRKKIHIISGIVIAIFSLLWLYLCYRFIFLELL